MAIKVACVCGKELSVKDEHAGKRVKCPACQKPLRIPSPKVEEESLDDECDTGDEWDTGDEQVEAPVTSRRAKPSSASGSVSRTRKGQGKGKKSSGSNRGLLIGLSAGAGVLVVAVLVWVLWPDPGEDNVAANPSRTEAETANSTKDNVAANPPRTEAETANSTKDDVAANPSRAEAETANSTDGKDLLTNTIGMKLKLIPAGEFQMGSRTGEAGRSDGEHQHPVRISQPFYMQTTEVTQGQWESVMRTTPWSGMGHVKEGTDYAASYVSWPIAVEFCRKLSAKEGVEYRLPSEAEWEYACRGGSSTAYSFEDNAALGDYAWWGGMSDGNAKDEKYAHRVGQKRANGFGLYDMHGNVWECCSDRYDKDYYKSSPLADPRGPSGGSGRVRRGGGWGDGAGYCRSYDRGRTPPGLRSPDLGFRVLRSSVASANPGGLAATDAPDTEKTAALKPLQPTPPDGKDLLTNTIGMKLKLIPAGEFQMGSPPGEAGHQDNEHQHPVRISQPFYMQTTEVTQGQWESVMGTTPWSANHRSKEGTDYAASYVSWDDAVEFCRKLSAKEGVEYRLPSEAEWEYACRGGSSTAYSFGDNASALGDYAWWGGRDGDGNAKEEQYAHRVGQKRANGFGLYDMHGNVFEWCSDWCDKDYYKTSPLADPRGPSGGSSRVIRGGSWYLNAGYCRSAARFRYSPALRYIYLGFRVLRSSVASANPGGLAATDAPDTEKTAAPKPLQPTPPDGKDLLTNTIGMKLKLIPAGEFQMGSPPGEAGRQYDEHPHRVRISQPFYMQTTEVTQGQWESVMGTTPWSGKSYVKEGTDYAASYVSWDDAVEFCRKLSAKDGVEYRLPSEAEWEYACRGGSSTAYSFGDNPSALSDSAWWGGLLPYDGNAKDEKYAHRVGQKRANGFSLYDMHGNVFEWCSDWYDKDYYKTSPLADPRGPSGGSRRVYRGGCWIHSPQSARSASRNWFSPDYRVSGVGCGSP